MPKIKTNRGAAKRFKRTANGKIRRNRAYTGHFFIRKGSSQKRNLRKAAYVSDADQSRVDRMLPK